MLAIEDIVKIDRIMAKVKKKKSIKGGKGSKDTGQIRIEQETKQVSVCVMGVRDIGFNCDRLSRWSKPGAMTRKRWINFPLSP